MFIIKSTKYFDYINPIDQYTANIYSDMNGCQKYAKFNKLFTKEYILYYPFT